MKPWEIWLSHISTIVVTVSGTAYFWMKYAIETDDPFSIVNHPWQPAMLGLHVVAAPVLVFVVGMMVQSHIQKKLESGTRANRASGLVSMVTMPVMIVSGYMLQVVTSPLLANVALTLHLASSLVFALTYVAHQVISFRLSRKSASAERPSIFARKQVA